MPQNRRVDAKTFKRLFGVLQRKYHILERGCRIWCKEKVAAVVKYCVVLYNMIVEDQTDEITEVACLDAGVLASEEVSFCFV